MSRETLSCRCGAMMVSKDGIWFCPLAKDNNYYHDMPIKDFRVGLYKQPTSSSFDFVDFVLFMSAQPKKGLPGPKGAFGSRAGRQRWKRSKCRRGTLAEWYDSQMPKCRRRVPPKHNNYMLDEIVGWLERKNANTQWRQLKKMREQ